MKAVGAERLPGRAVREEAAAEPPRREAPDWTQRASWVAIGFYVVAFWVAVAILRTWLA